MNQTISAYFENELPDRGKWIIFVGDFDVYYEKKVISPDIRVNLHS